MVRLILIEWLELRMLKQDSTSSLNLSQCRVCDKRYFLMVSYLGKWYEVCGYYATPPDVYIF